VIGPARAVRRDSVLGPARLCACDVKAEQRTERVTFGGRPPSVVRKQAHKPQGIGAYLFINGGFTAGRGVTFGKQLVEHVEDGIEPLRDLIVIGNDELNPASFRRCFARTIRWAIVRSSERNPRAICPVSKPNATRSVKAI
jgi:hypothetical protein